MAKFREVACIISHKKLSESLRELVLSAPQIAVSAQAGQFVHVKIDEKQLLRRPISIAGADVQAKTITLIYKIIGKGTVELATKQVGDTLDLLGPLGRPFTIQGKKPLLVGGGIGTAPLIFLAQALCPRPATAVVGGRTAEEMVWPKILVEVCDRIQVTTDDGTCGRKGLCIDLLPDLLTQGYDMVYTCGPKIMMEAVARAAKQAGVPCQVSLEEYMGCGLGACLSCTCSAATRKKRVKICTDGPVFFSDEVMEL